MLISRQLEIRRFSIHNDATLFPAVIDVNLTHEPQFAPHCLATWPHVSHRGHKWTFNFLSTTMSSVDLSGSSAPQSSTPAAGANPPFELAAVK